MPTWAANQIGRMFGNCSRSALAPPVLASLNNPGPHAIAEEFPSDSAKIASIGK